MGQGSIKPSEEQLGKYLDVLLRLAVHRCLNRPVGITSIYKEAGVNPRDGSRILDRLEDWGYIVCLRARWNRRSCIPTVEGILELVKRPEYASALVREGQCGVIKELSGIGIPESVVKGLREGAGLLFSWEFISHAYATGGLEAGLRERLDRLVSSLGLEGAMRVVEWEFKNLMGYPRYGMRFRFYMESLLLDLFLQYYNSINKILNTILMDSRYNNILHTVTGMVLRRYGRSLAYRKMPKAREYLSELLARFPALNPFRASYVVNDDKIMLVLKNPIEDSYSDAEVIKANVGDDVLELWIRQCRTDIYVKKTLITGDLVSKKSITSDLERKYGLTLKCPAILHEDDGVRIICHVAKWRDC